MTLWYSALLAAYLGIVAVAAGAFFVALTTSEVIVAALVATRPHRNAMFAVVAICAAPLAI